MKSPSRENFHHLPKGDLLVKYLASNRQFRGVGLTKASALWNRFGDALYDILTTGDVRALSSVIDENIAVGMVAAWAEQITEGKVIEWLDRNSFDIRLARKVISIWEGEVISKLTENPYRMLAFAPWVPVDRAARNLNIGPRSSVRLIAAVEYACYARLDSKHTLTSYELLIREIRQLLGCTEADAEEAIKLAAAEHAIIESPGGWQPLGPAAMERYIAERVQTLLSGTGGGQGNLYRKELSPPELEAILRTFETRDGIKLNVEQREAVHTAFTQSLSVLTGGAGVGKTTTLKVIHEVAEKTGRRIIQMALSGRAARQLRETTGREAMTIAAFLGVTRKGELSHADDATLVIIDEASMLDLPLTYRIFRTVSPRCCFLLVGDPYQLPPIGFGLVFHVLSGCQLIPRVELRQVHRQANSTGIPGTANAIRSGHPPELPAFQGRRPGVSFIGAEPNSIIDVIIELVDQLGGFDGTQILAPTKLGGSGTININRVFHDLLSVGKRNLQGYTFADGDPVIHLVNDYAKELTNGSLGKVTVASAAGELMVNFGHTQELLTPGLAEKLGLAYAITVHKAQGSQFQRVIMPVVPNPLLDRTLIYTAVTRAVEQVVLVGNRDSFRKAVSSQPHAHVRQTGLAFALADRFQISL